ncbi:hypothetical protein EKK58_02525 [Candidatus Dependentiae bacterium]|nr:MAG: hypothetical protein EKK58_02525 [Candidatus Dependentiae bacterium]
MKSKYMLLTKNAHCTILYIGFFICGIQVLNGCDGVLQNDNVTNQMAAFLENEFKLEKEKFLYDNSKIITGLKDIFVSKMDGKKILADWKSANITKQHLIDVIDFMFFEKNDYSVVFVFLKANTRDKTCLIDCFIKNVQIELSLMATFFKNLGAYILLTQKDSCKNILNSPKFSNLTMEDFQTIKTQPTKKTN